MRILVTNDDGITAPGLVALYRAMRDLGDVSVVAPDRPQSATGLSMSVRTPLTAQHINVDNVFDGWAVGGKPADCVKLAMMELLEHRPDFVVSGINHGTNPGVYVLYSGTVAAAAEAAVFFGVPSMAVSLDISDEMDYNRAARIARRIFDCFTASRPRPGACWSVNIPKLQPGWPLGLRICRQGLVPYEAWYNRQDQGDGPRTYTLDYGQPVPFDQPDTDADAVLEGYIAVTPLRFDLTDGVMLAEMRSRDWPTDLS